MNSQTRLQRGHFTLKSSALAPTSTSYMGQDIIANHMKSHYRRIMSAKAAVDTSPPKSMKMHMKVRDQKKRADLESRSGTPQSLRTRSPSREFLNSSQNGFSPMNSARSRESLGWRPSTGTPLQRSLSVQSLDKYYPPAPSPSPRDRSPAQSQSSSSSSTRLPLPPPVSPIAREPRQKMRTGRQLRHHKDLRTLQSLEKSEQRTSNNLDNNVSTLLSGYDESRDMKAPMTAGHISAVEERFKETDDQSGIVNDMEDTSTWLVKGSRVPQLNLTQVSYSHRGPPSIRTIDGSNNFKANVWEEEQKYLKFISDVTTDILARGIFSNRVLQQVFEMHIERRKDHLDESRLQEMIEQLKEDLGITDS